MATRRKPVAIVAPVAAPEKPRVRVPARSRPSAFMSEMRPATTPYDAAANTKRIPNVADVGPQDVAKYQRRLRILARHLYRNDGWLRRAVSVLCTNVVGLGPTPKTPYPELNKLLKAWMRQADVRGNLPYGGLLNAAYKAETIDGEVFWRLRTRRRSDGLGIPIQVQLLESDHVPLDLTMTISPGAEITNGVQTFNDRKEFFYVHPRHPSRNGPLPPPEAVSAEVFFQQFRPPRFSSPRGETRFVAAIVKAINLGLYDVAEDTRKNLTTLLTGFIKRTAENVAEPLDGEEPGESSAAVEKAWNDLAFEPGTLAVLPPDTDIVFSKPEDTGASYEPHKRFGIMYLAACFDVLYEQVTGDWRGASDRTWRAGQVDLRKIVDEERARLEFQAVNPTIWGVIVTLEKEGLWSRPAGLSDVELYAQLAYSWPAAKNPNAYQDVKGHREAEAAGYTDRDTIIEELGGDPVEVDIRAAVAKKRAELLGLQYEGPGTGKGGSLAERLASLVEEIVEDAIARREKSDLEAVSGEETDDF